MSLVAPGQQRQRVVSWAFALLLALVTLDAMHELFGVAGHGYSNLIDNYPYDVVATGAALLMMARARATRERAWLVLGIGTLIWVIGDVLQDVYYSVTTAPPLNVSQPFWLLWYAFAIAAIVMLVRSRMSGFELARWIDGVALALVVATPGVALAVQPTIEKSRLHALADAVTIAYPVLDILLLGAAIGVIALAGWRPGRCWYLVLAGLSMWLIADALYSVQEVAQYAGRTGQTRYVAQSYDFLWPAGILVVAYAAWQPWEKVRAGRVSGWAAIALPILCQLVAFGTQVWGLVADIGDSERIMTMAVLAVVIVQLFVSRPHAEVEAPVALVPAPPVEPVVRPPM